MGLSSDEEYGAQISKQLEKCISQARLIAITNRPQISVG